MEAALRKSLETDEKAEHKAKKKVGKKLIQWYQGLMEEKKKLAAAAPAKVGKSGGKARAGSASRKRTVFM